jgi:hypothetical protein
LIYYILVHADAIVWLQYGAVQTNLTAPEIRSDRESSTAILAASHLYPGYDSMKLVCGKVMKVDERRGQLLDR